MFYPKPRQIDMLKVGRAPEILYFEHMDDLNKQLLCFMVPCSQRLYTAVWAEIQRYIHLSHDPKASFK